MSRRRLARERGRLNLTQQMVFKAQFPPESGCFKPQRETPGPQPLAALIEGQGTHASVIKYPKGEIWGQLPEIPTFLRLVRRDDPLIGQNKQCFFKA